MQKLIPSLRPPTSAESAARFCSDHDGYPLPCEACSRIAAVAS